MKVEGEGFALLLLETNRSAIASRCKLGFNLKAQGENLQIMRLEGSFIPIIGGLTVKEVISPKLAGDRCQKEP